MLWAINLIQEERLAERVKIESSLYANLFASFDLLDTSNRRIFDHGWVNFPLGNLQSHEESSQRNYYHLALKV